MSGRARHPSVDSSFRRQIEMVRPTRDAVAVPSVPAGYFLRSFAEGDEIAYDELFALAWPGAGTLAHTRAHALPGGFLVVEHEASRQLISSCVAFAPGTPANRGTPPTARWDGSSPIRRTAAAASARSSPRR